MIIGVGTDIIEISRIEQAVVKGKAFYNKIYTRKERDYYEEKQKKIETLAGLFSAKEAVSKALGTGFSGFGPEDIEIVPNYQGKPEVTLYAGAKKLAEQLGVTKVHISISHCQSYATSFVVIEGGVHHEITHTCPDAAGR